jgi:hypothetical protein
MIKLECKGQIPPANGDLVIVELGHKLVKKGEVIEVDDTKGEILLTKYPRNFKVYVAPEPELTKEPEQKNIEDYSDKQMKEYNRKSGKKGDKVSDSDQVEFV